jgi:hypothetical protein
VTSTVGYALYRQHVGASASALSIRSTAGLLSEIVSLRPDAGEMYHARMLAFLFARSSLRGACAPCLSLFSPPPQKLVREGGGFVKVLRENGIP